MSNELYAERLKANPSIWADGATHFIYHEDDPREGGRFYYEAGQFYKDVATQRSPWQKMYRKPLPSSLVVVTKPSQSDEAYSPGVGTRCEAVWLDMPDGGDRDWTLVVFKGHYINSDGTEQVWFSVEATGENIVRDVRDCEIRPRRTEKQKRRDDLAALITEANEHDTEPGYVASCIMMRYELMDKKKGAPPPWER